MDLRGDDSAALTAAVALLAESVHVSIRDLVPYHVPRYARFLAAALVPPPAMRTVLLRVITRDGTPIAVADWRVLDDELFLNGLSVLADFRGRGHGTALLADGLALARRLGLSHLGLDVACDNRLAIELYRRAGYRESHVASWRDVILQPSCGTTKILDWPSFQAHLGAYGFADLSLRGADRTVVSVRVVGKALRVPSDPPASVDLAGVRDLLGATRSVAVATPAQPHGIEFARFLRMRRATTPRR